MQVKSINVLTFIKLPLSLRPLICLFLSGRFTQVLLTGTSHKIVEKNVDVYLYISKHRPKFFILRVCD